MFPRRASWDKLFPLEIARCPSPIQPHFTYQPAQPQVEGGEGAAAQDMGASASSASPCPAVLQSSHHITSAISRPRPLRPVLKSRASLPMHRAFNQHPPALAASTSMDTPVDPPRCGPASASPSVPGRVWCPGRVARATGAQPSLSSFSDNRRQVQSR